MSQTSKTQEATFHPFSASQQSWRELLDEAVDRTRSWAAEVAAVEQQMFARALAAVDTWAQLAHDTVAYSQQVTAQARKLGFETVRKAGGA